MKQKIIASWLALLVFFLFAVPSPDSFAFFLARPVFISAPSAVLVDASTQQLVYAKIPHLRRPPASTTKLLTSIVALELLSLDTIVTVPRYVQGIPPSKINLRGGERFRVKDLVRALLINSANDAAETLAVAAAGSRGNFSLYMNQKARQIGCRDSHFVNPHGLPNAGQYSSAYDMALIMKTVQKYPFLVQTLRTKTMVISSLGGRRVFLRNHNKMLWLDRREVLGKTGWTRSARHCFVGEINLNGKKIFVAMLGSHSLWRDLKTLIDYQFGMMLPTIHQNEKLWARDRRKKIQLALKREGYYRGPVDGQFGPSTIRAVKKYQAAQKLQATGFVGPQTLSKLKPFSS